MPDDIAGLERELIEAQQLELRILSDDGRNPIQGAINRYAATASLYSDPIRLQSLINELKAAIKRYTLNSNIKGRVLGKNAIRKFLDESEMRDRSQKALRLISQSNERQAARRTQLAFMELEKEAGILKADIALFKQNAKIAQFTDKEILTQLVIAGKDKTGIAQGFAKRMKRVAVDAVRRERAAAEIDEYRKVAKANEKWDWIIISSKPCPDCDARGGRSMTLSQWERMGFPGSGRTICGRGCKCRLMPRSIADERFPDNKAFNFDSDKLVLTTAREERTLRAKSNQLK